MRVNFLNGLPEETTIHWHGLRLPNAMDGVPDVTQAPVGPGERFTYSFTARDAGTFWYHPHSNSSEQIGRGLHGVLIVEERTPPTVDRDIIWVIDDWLVGRDARLADAWNAPHHASHAGRYGNIATINGRTRPRMSVDAGERVRIRLINVANARIFNLHLEGHAPWIVAIDGQPVEPFRAASDDLYLGPGMRIDVIVDMTGEPAQESRVVDTYANARGVEIGRLVYGTGRRQGEALPDPAPLARNPIRPPDLRRAERHEIIFGGGAMGGMMGMSWGGMQNMMREGMFWLINGDVMRPGSDGAWRPFLTLRRDRTHILRMRNRTAFDHPIHLHGYSFRVLARNSRPLDRRLLQDTVMMAPDETVDIAFVADNPGDWMFHCHILEHQNAGMMGMIRVA